MCEQLFFSNQEHRVACFALILYSFMVFSQGNIVLMPFETVMNQNWKDDEWQEFYLETDFFKK